jgi:hypothetical protein
MMFPTGLLALYYTDRTLKRPMIQNHNIGQGNTGGKDMKSIAAPTDSMSHSLLELPNVPFLE